MKNIQFKLVALMIASAPWIAAGAHEPQAAPRPMPAGAPMHSMTGMTPHDMKDMKSMHGNMSAGSMEMHKAMMSGMDMKMKMSGNVDKDFAIMMAMHHQQAVRMADIEIARGSNPRLKEMARKMKAAQQLEIQQLAQYSK